MNLNDDLSTTSGIESDGGEDDDEIESDDEVGEADNGDSSDSESGGFEPFLEEIQRHLPNPQTIFPLRPDNLVPLFVPEDTWDLHRFGPDFATEAEQPTYTFLCPLPCFLDSIDLGQRARDKSDWQECWPAWRRVELPLQGLVGRLVEMHKMQGATQEWKTRKLRGRQRRQDRVALNSSNSGHRATSPKARDRRRTADSLGIQSGDSPGKRPATGSFCKKMFAASAMFIRVPKPSARAIDPVLARPRQQQHPRRGETPPYQRLASCPSFPGLPFAVQTWQLQADQRQGSDRGQAQVLQFLHLQDLAQPLRRRPTHLRYQRQP